MSDERSYLEKDAPIVAGTASYLWRLTNNDPEECLDMRVWLSGAATAFAAHPRRELLDELLFLIDLLKFKHEILRNSE